MNKLSWLVFFLLFAMEGFSQGIELNDNYFQNYSFSTQKLLYESFGENSIFERDKIKDNPNPIFYYVYTREKETAFKDRLERASQQTSSFIQGANMSRDFINGAINVVGAGVPSIALIGSLSEAAQVISKYEVDQYFDQMIYEENSKLKNVFNSILYHKKNELASLSEEEKAFYIAGVMVEMLDDESPSLRDFSIKEYAVQVYNLLELRKNKSSSNSEDANNLQLDFTLLRKEMRELDSIHNNSLVELNERNVQDVTIFAQQMENLISGIGTISSEIEKNKERIEENERRIRVNRNSIEKNRVLISENRNMININRYKIDELDQRVSNLEKQYFIIDEKLDTIISNQRKLYDGLLIIDEKINYMVGRLDTVFLVINSLRLEEFRYHKENMESLNFMFIYMQNQFNNIQRKQDVLIEGINATYFKDYNLCPELLSRLPVKTLQDLRDNFIISGSSSSSCLRELKTIVSSEATDYPFKMTTYFEANFEGKSYFENELNEVYKPISNLYFHTFNESFYDASFVTLITPPNKILSDGQLTWYFYQNADSLSVYSSQYNIEELLMPSNFYNYKAVIKISRDFLKAFPYYELDSADGLYTPINKDDFTEKFSSSVRREKLKSLILNLNFLLKKINTSIAQQSLLSGVNIVNSIHNELFYSQEYNHERVMMIIRALNTNYHLQQNLLKNIFYQSSISFSDDFNNFFDRLKNENSIDSFLLKNMNLNLSKTGLPVEFVCDSISGIYNLSLEIKLTEYSELLNNEKFSTFNIINSTKDGMVIPIYSSYETLSDDYFFRSSIAELISIKSKIIEKIFDINLGLE